MFLSVVISAFNEEKRLPGTLKKVRDYLTRQKYDWEVLIVNDGSKDRTGEVVSEFITRQYPSKDTGLKIPSEDFGPTRSASALDHAPRPPRVAFEDTGFAPLKGIFRLIDNKENKGKGAAVKQGMLEAKGEWRLFMDADNSTDISEIEKLFNFASKLNGLGGAASIVNSHGQGAKKTNNLTSRPNKLPHPNLQTFYDVIIGSRYLKADSIKIKQPFIRRIVSRIGNWLIRILLGLDLKDTQCGFKLFSSKAAEDIFPKQTIDRWGFDMEILAIARKKGYKIKEVAVDWYNSTGSTVKKSAALKTLKELFIIKWNLIRGKYS